MEFFILFVVTFCFFCYGVVIGWRARERHAEKIADKLMESVENQIKEQQKATIQITIEEHSGVFYVYDKNDNTFMAQGKSKEELEIALGSRFPGKKFAATEEDLQKVGFIS